MWCHARRLAIAVGFQLFFQDEEEDADLSSEEYKPRVQNLYKPYRRNLVSLSTASATVLLLLSVEEMRVATLSNRSFAVSGTPVVLLEDGEVVGVILCKVFWFQLAVGATIQGYNKWEKYVQLDAKKSITTIRRSQDRYFIAGIAGSLDQGAMAVQCWSFNINNGGGDGHLHHRSSVLVAT